MARLAERLYGPALVATGPTTVYTASADAKVVVRYIHVSNPTGNAATLTLSIGADGVTTRLLSAYSIPAAAAGVVDSVRQIGVYLVLDDNEYIQIGSGTNNALVITINGDVYEPAIEDNATKWPKRLCGPARVATGPTTVYTVPTDTKTILRYLHVSNPSASAVTLTVSIGSDAAGHRIYQTYSIPAAAAGVSDSIRTIGLYIIMEATEVLSVSSGTNDVLVISANGEEISPADSTGGGIGAQGPTGPTGPAGASGIPIGGGCEFYGAVLPAYFFWQNGAEYSETTYSDLFDVIGHTYDTGGETSGYFRVPDARERYAVCKGPTYFPTLGFKGGSLTHFHTVSGGAETDGAESVAVDGTSGAGSSHSHLLGVTEGTNMETIGSGSYSEYPGNAAETGAESAHTHEEGSFTVQLPGHTHGVANTDPEDNAAPYITVNKIIRYI